MINVSCCQLEKQRRSDVLLSERLASLGIMSVQWVPLLKPLEPSQHYRIERFKGAPDWASMMPRDASFSDSRCKFFQSGDWMYTQRNLVWILLHQTEISLCLPFSDWFGTKRKFVWLWFGTKRNSIWFQINQKMVNTIWFRFYLTKFRKYFSVCIKK